VPTTSLEVLPVIHARRGHLVGPDAEPLDEELRTVARRFSDNFDGVYLVDLEGLQNNRPDVELIQNMAKRVHVWADTGPRDATDLMDMIMAGAEQVTVRHQTAQVRAEVEEAVSVTENVALGMEFEDQSLVENRSWPATPQALADLADELKIPLVVVDHSRAGTATGVDKSVAWHGREHEPGAYYAGGISSQRDLDVLEDLGYQGALVSTTLIEGKDIRGEDWSGPPGVDPDADPDPGAGGTGSGSIPGPDPTGGLF
jgi:uncharacterized protein related to proFAR isomerase